jgi:hypothetical protein
MFASLCRSSTFAKNQLANQVLSKATLRVTTTLCLAEIHSLFEKFSYVSDFVAPPHGAHFP